MSGGGVYWWEVRWERLPETNQGGLVDHNSELVPDGMLRFQEWIPRIDLESSGCNMAGGPERARLQAGRLAGSGCSHAGRGDELRPWA